ncbi:early 94 kDa protein [Phthorimaea operculella]|nr:early 94 kDa protein [Phthorimaea operculella]
MDVEEIITGVIGDSEAPAESKVVYLHWGDRCSEVDEDTVRDTYLFREGNHNATDPTLITAWLQSENNTFGEHDKIKLLYVITDGLINERLLRRSFKMNMNMDYEKVVFHAINESLHEINLSVAASFFKSHCMVYRNNELIDNTDISKEYDYDKINAFNFASVKEELKSYIKLKFIRKFKTDTTTLQEIEKLKKLQNRLVKELFSPTTSSANSKIDLETKDRNVFLREFVRTDWYKNLNVPMNVENLYDIEYSISTMIRYIRNDSKSYSFDALKFDIEYEKYARETGTFVDELTPEPVIELPDVLLDDNKEIFVVILHELNLLDKIYSHNVTLEEYNKFKSKMACPLHLLNDQEIGCSIGYFYSLKIFRQLLANNTKTDPQTRKPFHGGLVLSDSIQFDKYNDYILSITYFDGKKVNYNVGLFYFVLLKTCENKYWIDKSVVEQLKQYALRRIQETVCPIGLSSSPIDPLENTSLLTSLWYCVEMSSYIFKNDYQNFNHERMRIYHDVAHYMIEILKYFEYDLNLGAIKKRIELISHVMTLKQFKKRRERVYYLLKKIFKTVDEFLVSDIEQPSNLYILNYLKLNEKDILRDNIVEEKNHLNDYVHLIYYEDCLNASEDNKSTFEICNKTFRPYFAIDQNKSFYEELTKNTKKVIINHDDDPSKIEVTFETISSLEFDKILSLCKMFIDCVKESMEYPTLAEYVQYVSKKKKFHWDLVTIFPSNIYSDLKYVYDCYQRVLTNVGVSEFIKVSMTYKNRNERIKAEGKVAFKSEDEISDFIYSEESKANVSY